MHPHRLRAIAPIVLALVLSGCWLQAGGGPGNTRVNAAERSLTRANVASLAEQWRTPIDGFVTEPLVSGDRIYVATRSHDDGGSLLDLLAVQAYDRATGDLVWERSLLPTGGPAVTGHVETPALDGGVLWVPYWHEGLGACAGALARLDAATGAVLGTDATAVPSSDVVRAGSVVASTESGCGTGAQLVVRDAASRAVRWTHRFPALDAGTPVIADGRVFVVAEGTVHAFAVDGCGAGTCAPLWTRAVGGADAEFIRLTAGPDGSVVSIGAPPEPGTVGSVDVLEVATGDVRWQAEPRYTGSIPGRITGFAVTRDTVYVAGSQADESTSATRAILDAYPTGGCGQPTCAPAWTADLGPTRPSRAPTVAGGVVYVPLAGTDRVAPAVAAVDAGGCGAATCQEVTRVPLVQGSGPFISGTQLYVTSVGSGRVVVGWLPGLYGSTDSELLSLGPASG